MRGEPGLRAILFDVDGTLIDTVQLIVKALDYTYRKHLGIALPHEEIRRLIGLPLHVQMHYLDDRVSHPVDHLQMENDERAYYEAHRHEERVIPEMVEAVREAKRRGYRTALVTSKNRLEYAISRPQLQLDDWIDTLVTAEDTERHKPHPDPVLKALERLKVAPEEALYIGDTVYDLTCGRSAGTQVAAVAWGAHLPEDLRAAQPDYFFEHPQDVLDWIRTLPPIDDDGTPKEDSFRVSPASLRGGSRYE
ncbi:MAG: HAD-IA family hydrolase [Fimbriimonadales bacterium]|jgi:pyrophosphatase PpaX|nr:HAD-IA family hydrolase [Fimbriimonadales bacterium]GIV13192.1 MAG: pyrophosphatase PpaX [Fimbriimonadales bacterium]